MTFFILKVEEAFYSILLTVFKIYDNECSKNKSPIYWSPKSLDLGGKACDSQI